MHVVIVGGTEEARSEAARAETGAAAPIVTIDPEALPFAGPGLILPAAPPSSASPSRVFRVDHIERAFPNKQSQGVRLVLTQSTYLLQKLVDTLGKGDRIVATADRWEIERHAPELFFGRGPWRLFELVEIEPKEQEQDAQGARVATRASGGGGLVRAYRSESAVERLRLCREAAGESPGSAVAALALASACRENQQIGEARAALDRAEALAPGWEAVWYESGTFWLACEDMEAAARAFRRAADLMPAFSAAFGSLGAALGELDQPESALRAFAHALEHDPNSFTVLNNIGVVNRELGRLDESIAASRRVIELAPDFVFGYYNLGHALLLAERYDESIAVYEQGREKDPDRNRRQGCRLALARFATGDAAGATRELWQLADAAPPEEREALLLEAYEITLALIAARPELAAHQTFLDRIAEGLVGSR